MTNPAQREAALPTPALLGAAALGATAAGVGWGAFALVLGRGVNGAIEGLLAAGVVAVSATLALGAIRPWKPRPLTQWPAVWVGASFLRMAVTLAGTFLLYSATPFGERTLWFAVMLAYLAAMAGETRVYALSMRRFAPSHAFTEGSPAASGSASPGPPERA